MKSITMAAAAMFIAGSVFALTEAATKVQVYDFKASLKNSNIGRKLDRKLNAYYCDKTTENNLLGGYLIVPECTSCIEDGGDGTSILYLTRKRDTDNVVYRLTAEFAIANVFASRSQWDVDEDDFVVTLSKNAEGFLVINPSEYDEDISGFFNRDYNANTDMSVDEGVTKFWAAGFGKVKAEKDTTEVIPSDDPCIPPEVVEIPGCMYLDNLSGQIVGIMQMTAICGVPYVDLCTVDSTCVIEDSENAVASGSWQIRRNASMVSDSVEDAEAAVRAKFSGFQIVNDSNPQSVE